MVNPLEIVPTTFLTLLNTPETVLLTNELAPLTIPIPPSKGPLVNPSIGLSTRSYIPEAKFFNNLAGLPITDKLPKIAGS